MQPSRLFPAVREKTSTRPASAASTASRRAWSGAGCTLRPRAPFLGLLSRGGGGSGRGRSGRSGAALLRHLHCGGGLGRQEGQLGGDRTRAGGPAEEPAQLAHREAVHSLQVGRPAGERGLAGTRLEEGLRGALGGEESGVA